MNPVVYFAAILWLSVTFAKVEIAIEDGHGWATDLPTWRLSSNNWVSRIFFSGKPATGYHVWMELFIISVLHSTYIYLPFSWATELAILASFFYFSVFEDFLWFILNPAFGIENFHKDKIWWHRKHWLWIAPLDYYIFLTIGTVLYTAAHYLP